MNQSTPRVVAFDLGHTLLDERTHDGRLMPDVLDVLPRLPVPLAVWTNTRTAREADVRRWLADSGIERFFTWVITSVDAGARKPAPAFFEFALARCGWTKADVLFVGNQLNTDVRGGAGFGIRTVWLAGADYRSDDDDEFDKIEPSFVIQRLNELPFLLKRLGIEVGTRV